MSNLLVVSFKDPYGAQDAFEKLREFSRRRILHLGNSCIAERSDRGRLRLKQILGNMMDSSVAKASWNWISVDKLWTDLFPSPPEDHPAEWELSRHHFAKRLSRGLEPGQSALFTAIETEAPVHLEEAFVGHEGTLIRTTLPTDQRQAVSGVLAPQRPPVPTAQDLRLLVNRHQIERAETLRLGREVARSEADEKMRRLRTEPMTEAELQKIVQRCAIAASQGRDNALAFRFPAALCADRGRAINNGDADWPQSLMGKPWQVYEYWMTELRPAGYHMQAQVLTYPEGMPGEIGLTLSWE